MKMDNLPPGTEVTFLWYCPFERRAGWRDNGVITKKIVLTGGTVYVVEHPYGSPAFVTSNGVKVRSLPKVDLEDFL